MIYLVLWPLLHYILPTPTDGQTERQRWTDYLRFNHAFAMKILELYQPGDIVLVHDYQLLLVPELLRQKAGAGIHVGLFVHTPFPTSEIVRCLSSKFLSSYRNMLVPCFSFAPVSLFW